MQQRVSSYATLLVQTPLGLISNALLVPLLPTFARLTAPEDRPQLIERIRQGLMLSTASMTPLGGLFIALGAPIVALIYERGAFDGSAAQLVTGLLMAYGLGMPAYLGRDVLVRVFYALGDGTTPFRLSLAGIGLNVIFDWLLVGGPTPWGNQSPLNFGAPGLVLATVAINVITCVALLLVLQRRLQGLPLRSWGLDATRLAIAGVMAALVAWLLLTLGRWPEGLIGLSLQVGLPGLLGLCPYLDWLAPPSVFRSCLVWLRRSGAGSGVYKTHVSLFAHLNRQLQLLTTHQLGTMDRNDPCLDPEFLEGGFQFLNQGFLHLGLWIHNPADQPLPKSPDSLPHHLARIGDLDDQHTTLSVELQPYPQ